MGPLQGGPQQKDFMFTQNVARFLLKKAEYVLRFVGRLVNQCPTKEEIKRLRHSPIFNNPFTKKNDSSFRPQNDLNHKRDHAPKGAFNTDARIFNKPRG